MKFRVTKKRKPNLILTALFCALVCYFIATLISLRSQIKAEEKNIENLNNAYQQQVDDNAELQIIIDNSDDAAYVERVAREQYGYAKPGERIYYDSINP